MYTHSILEAALAQNKTVFSEKSPMKILTKENNKEKVNFSPHLKYYHQMLTASLRETGTDPVGSSRYSFPSVR